MFYVTYNLRFVYNVTNMQNESQTIFFSMKKHFRKNVIYLASKLCRKEIKRRVNNNQFKMFISFMQAFIIKV